MDSLELNKSKYIVSNIKEILHKKLILDKPLTKDEVKKLKLVNPLYTKKRSISFKNGGFIVLISENGKMWRLLFRGIMKIPIWRLSKWQKKHSMNSIYI